MSEINLIASLVCTITTFIIGMVWNGLIFGKAIVKLQGSGSQDSESRPPGWKLLVEFMRCFIMVNVLVIILSKLGIAHWLDALATTFILWVGFPLMLLTGAVIWQNEPWRLALIHVGDWLIKMVSIALILSIW